MKFTKLKLAALIASSSLLIACGSSSDSDTVSAESKLLETNAKIAYAVYSDAVTTAKNLQTALATFSEAPTDANLEAAKKAWLVSREPYGQSEVYRFREGPIDNEETGPEGDLNAWPLGEALIDYVAVNGADFDDGQVEVVTNSAGINNNGLVDGTIAEENIIQSNITIEAALLEGNSATNADESDVITGYHAIEFLLWGQDLNTDGNGTDGTDRGTAVKSYVFTHGGQRPLTDFTTDENAQRRHDYLEVVVAKLISDLEIVQTEWAPSADNHRADFVDASNSAATTAKITAIVQAMGTLSYGELAGERMQVAYAGNSQEDEHSCFSDNTHRDVWLNAEGVSNSYYGDYAGYDSNLDGNDNENTNAVSGYGFDDYLEEKGLSNLNADIKVALTATTTQYTAIDAAARGGNPFDVLIMDAQRNAGNPINTTIDALKAQSNGFISMAEELNLGAVSVADTTEAFD
ncbi:MAG: imelysin family protein [Bermanella sp.]